ncbi:MAG: DUF47 domain-containing protein [Abitibacteriaceae bacterium]|nr:DUF47 domain-containing protein [Abditibacteriaceae bacterium]MBV9867921.1 DUF47 domain-containing protein [Abditibacteriaceae bacterium]
MPFQILPAETKFYDWFEKGSTNLFEAARLLQDLMHNYERPETKIMHITDAERQGDFVVHEIHDLLHKTLITPLDPEDTQTLSHAIDNVVDTIEQTGILLLLYKVEKPTEEAVEMADILVKCAEQIKQAMPLLRDSKSLDQMSKYTIEVNRLENEGDALYRRALENLVESARNDWFDFTRWKAIYDLLEDATDQCEDIADVFQTVVLKNG